MRIVGGKHRGRRLTPPADRRVRPTVDRVREAIFNILTQGSSTLPPDTQVLDAFAGSGALGLEALSRGAGHVTFLDTDRESIALVKTNVRDLLEQEQVTVLMRDATHPGPADQACDLIFLDPPYGKGLAPVALRALSENGWIGPDAGIVVELGKKEPLDLPDGFSLEDERTYGDTRIVFLRTSC